LKEKNITISLTKMKEGQKGRILHILGGTNLQQRLMGLGIYPQKEIIKLSHFAMRGAVTVKTGRSVIALGHGMASKVMVETE